MRKEIEKNKMELLLLKIQLEVFLEYIKKFCYLMVG